MARKGSSKKALKKAKTRKEAQKRSRVLKERQDYTGGGRVKAQFGGFIPNLDLSEIEKRARAAAEDAAIKREQATIATEGGASPQESNQASGTGTTVSGSQPIGTQVPATNQAASSPTPTPQSSDVNLTAANQETQDQIAANQEARELEARREILRRNGTIGMDTDGDGRLSEAEKYKAVTGVDMPSIGEQPPSSEEAAPAATAAQQTGQAPPTPASAEDMLAGGNPYSDNLTPEQRAEQDRISQGDIDPFAEAAAEEAPSSDTPDDPAAVNGASPAGPNGETLMVVTKGLDGKDYPTPAAAYNANVAFLAAQEAPPSEEAPAEEGDRSNVWTLSYEEMNPFKERDASFGRGAGGAEAYKRYVDSWKAAQKWWDSKTPAQRQRGFSSPTGNPFTGTGPGLTTQYGSLGSGAGTGVGDPAQPVLDKISEDITQYRAKTDNVVDPIQTVKTDLTQDPSTLIADEQIQQIDPIDDIGQQTITAPDLTTTKGTAKTAALADAGEAAQMTATRAAADAASTAQTDVTREAEAGVRTELSERARAATIDAAREEASKAQAPIFATPVVEVDPVTGETFTLSATPDAEKAARQAITDEQAASGTEAIINSSLGYEAAERRELKGEAAKGAAVSMLEEVGGVPTDIAETILDNPATVTAQIDTNPVEVQAAIAALPQEALVSAQLESLLSGIDEGVTPSWARPAVRLVESRLNARGLNVSTVGRDALFNAIIQTALPIAQSNATALQQRATQNLSNEQQANILQANQDMQLRLTNLANRQTAETQSAQLAQQVNLTQGQFTQQTTLTQEQQEQQVRLQSLQNEQQIAVTNLGNDQQIEVANLQVEAQRLGANQSAVNQERLAEMQVAANFLQKNGDFAQQMELANMSNEQQMRLAFLTAKNQAEAQNMSAAQQTELANLNKNLEVNKISAGLAQQMGLAQLNVDQQTAMANAANVANMNMAQFNSEQQIELANSKFMQTMTLQDFTQNQQAIMQNATAMAALDAQAADAVTKVSIENARTFLQTDLANLNAEQQSYVLNSQQRQQAILSNQAAENAASQFNATSTNQRDQFMANLGSQMNQFNASQANAMSQFNATEANRLEAIAANNDIEAQKAQASLNAQIDQYNASVDFQREQWNAQNEQAVIQSNIAWRRQLNTAETAAENAANQQAANQSFQLTSTEQAFIWQLLRDEATYLRQQYESEQTRKTNLYATALSNESEKAVSARTSTFNIIDGLFGKLGAA